MRKNRTPPRAAIGGFTLIELMITVAIVAVLATIAAAAYSRQIQQSRRTDARNALMDLAGREEKLFSTTNAYSAAATDLGYVGVFPQAVGSGYYTVNVLAPDPAQGVATPTTFSITATAIGTQANDGAWLTLSVNQTGVQTSTGTGTVATCWGN